MAVSAGGAQLVGVISGDVVSLVATGATGAMVNKGIGTLKPVTISGLTLGGTDAANYSLTQPTTSVTITALGLTVTGVTATDRVYNGTNAAAVNAGGAQLVGVISGDIVSLVATGATGAMANKGIGTLKPVTVSGLTLGDTDAANYTLTQPTTSVTITALGLTVTGVTVCCGHGLQYRWDRRVPSGDKLVSVYGSELSLEDPGHQRDALDGLHLE